MIGVCKIKGRYQGRLSVVNTRFIVRCSECGKPSVKYVKFTVGGPLRMSEIEAAVDYDSLVQLYDKDNQLNYPLDREEV